VNDEMIKKESRNINQSLSYLGFNIILSLLFDIKIEQIIVNLSKKSSSSSHIPYRQSKLTNILKDSIGN